MPVTVAIYQLLKLSVKKWAQKRLNLLDKHLVDHLYLQIQTFISKVALSFCHRLTQLMVTILFTGTVDSEMGKVQYTTREILKNLISLRCVLDSLLAVKTMAAVVTT